MLNTFEFLQLIAQRVKQHHHTQFNCVYNSLCCAIRLRVYRALNDIIIEYTTEPASQTSVSMLNLLMLLLLSLTTVAQLLNFLGCCGAGNDNGGSSSSASSRQLSADSSSIRSDVESPPDGYFTMCWPAAYTRYPIRFYCAVDGPVPERTPHQKLPLTFRVYLFPLPSPDDSKLYLCILSVRPTQTSPYFIFLPVISNYLTRSEPSPHQSLFPYYHYFLSPFFAHIFQCLNSYNY